MQADVLSIIYHLEDGILRMFSNRLVLNRTSNHLGHLRAHFLEDFAPDRPLHHNRDF